MSQIASLDKRLQKMLGMALTTSVSNMNCQSLERNYLSRKPAFPTSRKRLPQSGGANAPAKNPTSKDMFWRGAEPTPRPKTPRAKICFGEWRSQCPSRKPPRAKQTAGEGRGQRPGPKTQRTKKRPETGGASVVMAAERVGGQPETWWP